MVNDKMVDDLAAVLWHTEAVDAGTPQSVVEGRTREAFNDQAEGLKDRWRKYARAALAHREAEAVACEDCAGTGFKDKNGARLTLARTPCPKCAGHGFIASSSSALVAPPAQEVVAEPVLYISDKMTVASPRLYSQMVPHAKAGWKPLYAAPPAVPADERVVERLRARMTHMETAPNGSEYECIDEDLADAADAITAQAAEIERLRALLDKAVEALSEAKEDVESWGAYAGNYFQDKHDLDGNLDRISKQITAIQEARHA